MTLGERIRDLRVFSISMSVFTSYLLYQTFIWIYAINLLTLTAVAAGMVATTLAALCALVKMCFTFATANKDNS